LTITHAQVASTLELLEVAPGDAVIREGEAGHDMYIVADGTLSVYKSTHQEVPSPRHKYPDRNPDLTEISLHF
jgi:signal-transduction protein with cAMP-binding, CBS, and nucleotidyltransferase domain